MAPQPNRHKINTESLPPVLRLDGPMAIALKASMVDDQSRVLHGYIARDLKAVQQRYFILKNKVVKSGKTASKRRLLNSAISQARSIHDYDKVDDVLAYCLIEQSGLQELLDDRWPQAYEAYRARVNDYDAVFGTLIPERLKKAATTALAVDAYDQGTNASAVDDWDTYLDDVVAEVRSGSFVLGLKTGLPSVDEAMFGLRGMTILAGDKGVGKTTLALNWAIGALRAHEDLAVMFCTLDMRKKAIYSRLLEHESGIDYRKLYSKSRSEEDLSLIRDASARLRKELLPRLRVVELRNLVSHEYDALYLMKQYILQLKETSGAGRFLAIIDLLQNIPLPSELPVGVDADRYRIELVKSLYNWLGAPVVLISEVRKDSDRRELCLDDVLGSTHLGYTPDNVLLLWPSSAVNPLAPTIPMVLRIAKGRDGVMRADLKLEFDHLVSRFRDGSSPPPEAERKVRGKVKLARPAVDPLAGGK